MAHTSPPISPGSAPRAALLVLLALFLAGFGEGQGLGTGESVQQSLGPGESTTHPFELQEAELLNLIVEQKGVDLRLRLVGPEGQIAAQVNRAATGSEQLLWVCPRAGRYVLEIAPANDSSGDGAQAGGYQLRVVERRPATREDRLLIEAQQIYTEALALKARDTADSIRQAIEKYRQALPLWLELDQAAVAASTLNNLGSAYMSLGQAQRALDFYDQALTLWRRLEDRQGEADTLKAAATAHYALGQIDTALDGYREALELSRRIKDRGRELRVLYNIGALYRRRGESQQALDYLHQALTLRREQKDLAGEAATLNSIALVYLNLGEPVRGLPFLERALELNRRQQDASAEAATRLNLGSAYSALEDPAKAREEYQRSLTLSVETGNRTLQAQALNNLGWELKRGAAGGALQQALEHFQQALALSRAGGDLQTEAIALDNIGEVLTSLDRPEEALQHFSQALPLRRAVLDRAGEAGTLAGMAAVERGRGRLRQARVLLEQALDITEALRSNAPSQSLRSTFLASKRPYYETYLEVLVEQHRREPDAGHDAAALVASERARARSLLELLTEAHIDIESGIDPELKQQERELAARLNHIQGQILELRTSAQPDADQLATWEAEWQHAEQDRERLEWRIRSGYPDYAQLQYPLPLATDEIRALLPADAALLEYSLGEDRSFLFVVTRQALEIIALPPAAEIEARVQEALGGLRSPGRRELGRYLTASYWLYSTLVAPALQAVGDRHQLLIAPDRSLYYLSFESLLTAPPTVTARQSLADLPYLLRRGPISYVPSATVLSRLERRQKTPAPDAAPDSATPPDERPAPLALVAFADPVYEAKEASSTAAVSPGPADAVSPGEEETVTLRDVLPAGAFRRPARLEESGLEVQEIARLFPEGEVSLYLRHAAREEKVKASEEVRRARHLHFATHAVADEGRPEYSSLVLSLDGTSEAGSATEDGLLQVYEIFNLRLEAELVTLSACETGLGKAVTGEGLIGLTQAFLYAGAPSLVVSLWQVADRSTASLMVSFYEHLESAPTKAEALRQAKLDVIRDGRFAHPFHWAPFILVGRP